MLTKSFPIDFIRQIIEQTMLYEHNKNVNLIGGKNQVNLFSFYEQLEQQDEVDRYVDFYRELTEQQNRSNLIANGVIASPENPTITNINQKTIIPLTFVGSFRLKLENRDLVLDAINNVISIHKGRKVDIAEFDNGKVFMVGTFGNNSIGVPTIKSGDFIGTIPTSPQTTVNDYVSGKIAKLVNIDGFVSTLEENDYLYYEDENGLLCVAKYSNGTWGKVIDDGNQENIIFPPEHKSFKKYKVSLSFDSIRCDEPRNLNGDEVISISFGGSATITNLSVLLGNDLTKLMIKPSHYIDKDGTHDYGANEYWLEPLEMPSNNNVDTQVNKLMSNKFIANTHSDSIALSLQYSFILDMDIDLIAMWFEYGRYGIQNDVSPNTIYLVRELYCEWGNIHKYEFLTKIVENVEITNTESDTLSITIPMQIQGDNN